ncbi:MAG: hypothetical protein FJ033_08280 [Chloroflexi bacterium]|nr:hypothetical protein [Chloroflexota bacterium]
MRLYDPLTEHLAVARLRGHDRAVVVARLERLARRLGVPHWHEGSRSPAGDGRLHTLGLAANGEPPAA